jgi:hypothetical protein
MRWAKSRILTLAMDLDGLCLMGITLFHIYYACPFPKKKTCPIYVYAQRASTYQKFIYARACRASHMIFLHQTLPIRYC